MAMASVATRTVSVTASGVSVAAITALVEQNHDGDEGEDGEQNADEDDEAIRSLHENYPFERGWISKE